MDWSLPVHGGRYEKTDIRGQQCGQAADLHCTQGADDPETPEQDHRGGDHAGLRHGAPAFLLPFDDVYDAVRWIFEEEAVALLREHEGVMLWQDGLLQLFQYLQENRAFCLCALRSMGRDHLKRFFQTDIRTIIQSTIRLIAAELGYEAGEQELTMLTQFYVGALVSIVEDWLLGEIQGTPEELIRFVDQVLRDHVRGAGLRLSQAGPGAAPLLEPDHCAGPVSK